MNRKQFHTCRYENCNAKESIPHSVTLHLKRPNPSPNPDDHQARKSLSNWKNKHKDKFQSVEDMIYFLENNKFRVRENINFGNRNSNNIEQQNEHVERVNVNNNSGQVLIISNIFY